MLRELMVNCISSSKNFQHLNQTPFHSIYLLLVNTLKIYIYIFILFICLASLVAQSVKCLTTMQETWVQSLGLEDLLEKEIVAHSSILAWRITWTEKPGRLLSMVSREAGTTKHTALDLRRGAQGLQLSHVESFLAEVCGILELRYVNSQL